MTTRPSDKVLTKYIETSHILAAVIMTGAIAGLGFDKLTGGEYVQICGIVVAGFGVKESLATYFRCKHGAQEVDR